MLSRKSRKHTEHGAYLRMAPKTAVLRVVVPEGKACSICSKASNESQGCPEKKR